MRELKFRTWNWLENRYDKQPCAFITVGGELTPSVNRIIEQYTGLTDKNGKEIYEGDILADKDYVGKVWTCAVDYDENLAQFYCTTTYGECWTFEDAKGDELEVIGNIHENPELLEGKK